MKAFSRVSIEQLCLETSQCDPRQEPDAFFDYVDISSVDRETKTISATVKMMGANAPSRARKEIRGGDILVSTVRPTLNAVAMVPETLDGQIASTGFCVLRTDPQRLIGKYLYYFTRTEDFVAYLVKRISGANYPAVTDKVVKDVPIPLPPIPEQKRIVRILDEADALRQLRARADTRTNDLIPALFNEVFGDLSTNEKQWPQYNLGDITTRITNGYVGPTRDIYRDSGVPYILSRHIHKNVLTFDGETFISEEFNNKNKKSILCRDDVLLVQTGHAGDAAVVPPEHAGHNCHALIVITAKKDFLIGDFLSHYLTSPVGRDKTLGIQTGATLKHLNCRDVRKIRLPIPDLPLQHEFAARVAEVRAMQAQQARSRQRLEDLFQALLQRAFNGEL